MIVSRKHEFLFFELPRTGTTSIRNKLIDRNIGEISRRIHRHGSISKYRRIFW